MAAEQSAGAGAVYLTHRHVFGLKADVRNNVHFHDENQVILLCIVRLKNLESLTLIFWTH